MARTKLDQQHQKEKQLADDDNSVDYELLLSLIPNKQFTQELRNEKKKLEKGQACISAFSEIGTSLDEETRQYLEEEILPKNAQFEPMSGFSLA